MAITFTSQIVILFLQLVFAITFCLSISKPPLCNEKDRVTLLIFKKGIIDHYGLLSSWSTKQNCCAWEGVYCSNITGRVTQLVLSQQYTSVYKKPLEGEINFSFLELEFLNHVDLSNNKFNVTNIPPITHNLSHVSHLQYLDLSLNELQMDNLDWLSQHSSLEYLGLTGIDLHKETNWLQQVAMLPSLSELYLNSCDLETIMVSPFLNYVNLSSLVVLDLVGNNFNSELPNGLFNVTSELITLGLSFSNIRGEIPSSLFYLRNLSSLYLSNNQLKGSIPDLIGQLEHLQDLYIHNNMLSGSIPSTLGNLSSLVRLFIGSNCFSEEISETTFSKLSNLETLDMSNSSFVFQLDPDWMPPFQLIRLHLANTNQGPDFPSWIYTQYSIKNLDLSSTGISLAGEDRFWSFVEGIQEVYLSNNSMSGDISTKSYRFDVQLDHNNFTGRLPCISPLAIVLDFSYNSFSGSIPNCWKKADNLVVLNLWSNRLSGEVHDISNFKQLQVMNLGKNNFSGTIPINISPYLYVIILRSNHFEGNIPSELFNLVDLFHMDLAHNNLSGPIPHCPYNMTQMVTTYLGITWWSANIDLYTKGQDYVYQVNPIRRTIDLSVNNLFGTIPLELFHLIQVQTLNLSHNNLNGIVPSTIGRMINMESLDLSNNKFYGKIPENLSLLTFLGYLNLSYNNFSGKIPTGTQLQSFNATSYIENPELCGDPLKKCFKEEEDPKNAKPSTWNQDDNPFKESLYLGMGVGFAVGFWGICGSLFLIRKWRHTCFRFFDQLTDRIYVALMVKLNNFINSPSHAN